MDLITISTNSHARVQPCSSTVAKRKAFENKSMPCLLFLSPPCEGMKPYLGEQLPLHPSPRCHLPLAPSIEGEAMRSWIKDEIETLNLFFQLLLVLLFPEWPTPLRWYTNTFQGLGVIESSLASWDRSLGFLFSLCPEGTLKNSLKGCLSLGSYKRIP